MNIVRRVLYIVTLALASAIPAGAAGTIAKHHMIAAANPYAAEAGRQMMREGGSAVDAAIAAQLVLTLVEPESSGIGGGDFMMVYDPGTGKVTSFDGRETAPASATPGMFLDASGKPRGHFDAIPGGLSTGVPGVIAMFDMAHKKYGRLPWAKLFKPAIKLAENGFPVGRKLAATLRAFPQLAGMPDIKRYFYKQDGTPLAQGDILKNPELAEDASAHRERRAEGFLRWHYRATHRRCRAACTGQSRWYDAEPTLRPIMPSSGRPCAAHTALIVCAPWAHRVRAALRCCRSLACSNGFRRRSCSRTRLAKFICSRRPAASPSPTAPCIWVIRM